VKVFLAKDEEAIGEPSLAIEANRNFAAGHFYLAVALAELGRLDEARLEASAGLSIDPTFTIRRYRADAPSDNPVFLSRRMQIYDIMKSIGRRKDRREEEERQSDLALPWAQSLLRVV
jgi:hypothetical protein